MRIDLKDIAERFTITLAGMDTCEGQATYVLAFAPKANQGYRDQTEKVLNQLQGKMWISTTDYSVLKTDASLAQPVAIVWSWPRFRSSISTTNCRTPRVGWARLWSRRRWSSMRPSFKYGSGRRWR